MALTDQPYQLSRQVSNIGDIVPVIANKSLQATGSVGGSQLGLNPIIQSLSQNPISKLQSNVPALGGKINFPDRQPVSQIASSPFKDLHAPISPASMLSSAMGVGLPASAASYSMGALKTPERAGGLQLSQSPQVPLKPASPLSGATRQAAMHPSAVMLGESRSAPSQGRLDRMPLRSAQSIGTMPEMHREGAGGHPIAIAMSHMAKSLEMRRSQSTTEPRGVSGQLRQRGG